MWSQKVAQKIIRKKRKKYNITCGVSPSGPFHLGHLREVLTSDILAWSIKNLKKKVEVHFILDDFDHLRKVYPFLPKSFQKYVGKPLYLIPDPNHCHKNYAQHFFGPFKKTLKSLNINFKIYEAHTLYQKGLFNPYIEICLQKKDEIAEILKKVAGTKITKDFSPFKPLCPKCQTLTKTKILKIDFLKKEMEISCACGFKGKINYLNGNGKLMWRLHWAAWWQIFKTDVEPFGKEHGTLGGSYDTGKILMKRIFKKKAPIGVPYDLIYLKGTKGKMSSSLGNLITTEALNQTLPPEIIKYFILRVLPEKTIFFDPNDALRLSEEISSDLKRAEKTKLNPDKKTLFQYIFQTKNLKKAEMISWSYFLSITQLAKNSEDIAKLLRKSGHKLSLKKIKELEPKVRNWLKEFAKDDLILQINTQPAKITLKDKEKEFLKSFLNLIGKKIDNPEKIQNCIFDLIKKNNLKPKQGFTLIYRLLIGKNSGPKAGLLINIIGQEKISNLIKPLLK